MSWDHLTIVVTRKRAGRSGIIFAVHAINHPLFPQPTDCYGARPAFYSMDTRDSFLRLKRLQREVEDLYQSFL
jgi:hypothetical protein